MDSTSSDCGCRTDFLGGGVSKMDQLKLALTWNRVDVAEEKIFTPDTDWPVSETLFLALEVIYNQLKKISYIMVPFLLIFVSKLSVAKQ